MKKLIVLIGIVFQANLYGQIPSVSWVIDAPIRLLCLTSDANDNIYISGKMTETTLIEGDTIDPQQTDVFFAKIDSSGTLVWYKVVGGIESELPISIVVDQNENINLLFTTSTFIVIENDTIYTPGGHFPILANYSPNGILNWWKRLAYSNEGCVHSHTLLKDKSNNLIMKNNFWVSSSGSIIFPDTTINFTDGFCYVSKYNSNGEFLWARGFNNNINQVTTDKSNNILLIKETDSLSLCDFIKLSSNGNLIWKKSIEYPVLQYIESQDNDLPLLETDKYNNIYHASNFADTLHIGGQTYIARGNKDIILIKYDSTGAFVWGKAMGGPKYDYPSYLSKHNDNILLSGRYSYKIFFDTDSIINTGNGSGYGQTCGFLAEYDVNGTEASIFKIKGSYHIIELISTGVSVYLYGLVGDSVFFGNYFHSHYTGLPFIAKLYDDPVVVDTPQNAFLYPNPTKDKVYVDVDPSYGKTQIFIYNINGALVKSISTSAGHNEISLDFLLNGLYIVKIINNFKVLSGKLIKI